MEQSKPTKSEAVETMPSYFKSLNSSESHPLPSWHYLEEMIKTDPVLKSLTEIYRKRLAIGKAFADELKSSSPAVTVAVQMDGYGKQLANIVRATYLLMLDFDKIPRDKMEPFFQLICQDKHTWGCYKTISGRGYRVFCLYAPFDDEDVSMLELYDFMVKKAQKHYAELLDFEPDKACIDITRCSGLAYDPNAYFRYDAVPISLTPPDLKLLYTQKATEAKYSKRNAKRKARKAKTASTTEAKTPSTATKNAPTMEEAAPRILELLELWGKKFESGTHNEFVTAFGNVCVHYGIDKDEAMKYATLEFSALYPETASVLKSCYKHTERLGDWHFYRDGEGYSNHPSVKVIKQWLSTRYDFHQNIVTGFYELQSRMVLTGKFPRWTRIDDNIENSLWTEMDEQGLKISVKTLHDIVNSDFSTPYDPFDEYLRGLGPWNPDTDPDYIDELADRIEVAVKPEYQHTQETFRYYFKKWLVAMVVAWVTLKVVNQTILIFVGKGGIFKTTFFAYLLPPQLRQYFINDSTACYTDKDFMEAFSSKALACLDEFETCFGKNLSAFKSNITKLVFSIRRPYDKYRSELPHRASLCGTTNSQQFITDEENRRYSPWIVKSIQSPIDHPIDYDHVFAEAVALGKIVCEQQASQKSHPSQSLDWTFWLTKEDIEQMRHHNRLFMVANYAEEQILRFYRVPDKSTPTQYIKFRYSAEILEKIGSNPALRQNLNNQNIGSVMSRLGFKKVHKAKGNGWAVIEKEGTEINSDSFYDPNDKMEE